MKNLVLSLMPAFALIGGTVTVFAVSAYPAKPGVP